MKAVKFSCCLLLFLILQGGKALPSNISTVSPITESSSSSSRVISSQVNTTSPPNIRSTPSSETQPNNTENHTTNINGTTQGSTQTSNSTVPLPDPTTVSPGSTPTPNFCNMTSKAVFSTSCLPCSMSEILGCPDGTKEVSNQTCDRQGGEQEHCQSRCEMTMVHPECCHGYWGRDCKPCPSGPVDGNATGICSDHGQCSHGRSGHGNCSCDDGFTGTACELCEQEDVYGQNCDLNCDCVNGKCDAGRTGTGTCDCQHGYGGIHCETQTHCLEHLCGANAHCINNSQSVSCECDAGYRGGGKNCTLIDYCSEEFSRCHEAAECVMNGPSNFSCTCQEGYSGDGFVCQPIDPCQDMENLACLDNYTQCVYKGPGKFECQCQPGFKNYSIGIGCQMVDLCEENEDLCHRHANCTMVRPLLHRCECQEGYVGNGRACYGNILETLNELNIYNGNLRYKLNETIKLYSLMSRALEAKSGLTVFVPLDAGLRLDAATKNNKYLAAQIVRQHVIPVAKTMNELKYMRVLYTLEGNAALLLYNRRKRTMLFRIQGLADRARIITGNVVASNGVIHFIHRLLQKPPVIGYKPRQTLLPQIQSDGRYNRLESLLASAGLQDMLNSSSSNITVFAPNNKAWDSLPPGTVQYLQSRSGRGKLIALLKNHIFPGRILSSDLLYTSRLVSMANNAIQVRIDSRGRMILTKNSTISQSDIPAVGGVYHHVGGILIPESIMPLLPRFCNKVTEELVDGLCGPCTQPLHCPLSSDVPNLSHEPVNCTFSVGTNGSSLAGCSQPCLRRTTMKRCCDNFYGPNCNPCPGGHTSPCGGNGKCDDGITGSGICECQQNYTGTICDKCSNPMKYGPQCDQDCTCLNGICDNSISSEGHCKVGSCQRLHSGQNCDVVFKMCGRRTQCHVHSVCRMANISAQIVSRSPWWFLTFNHLRCYCKDGYRGDGKQCTAIKRCEDSDYGGCHQEAECTYVAPGQNNCTCNSGWVGDGTYCYPSTPCRYHTHCSPNAQCLATIPGEYRCECNENYHGNGTTCVANNMCDFDHGGCHPKATCKSLGPGNRTCTCRMGYAGDGISCFGNIWQEIQEHAQISAFADLLFRGRFSDLLSDYTRPFTVFAPVNSSLLGVGGNATLIPDLQYLRYHIVQGIYDTEHLANLALTRGTSGSYFLPTLAHTGQNSPEINITYSNHGLLINSAQVLSGNHSALNGILHILSGDLHPLEPSSNVGQLFSKHQSMSQYYIDLNRTGLLAAISNHSISEYTIFAVENSLWRPSLELDQLKKYMSYYVLQYDISYDALASRSQVTTLLGPGPSSKLNITSKNGKVFVNGILVQDDRLKTPRGSVFKLMSMLQPNLNRCDKQLADGSMQIECCPGFYGYNCLECPGGSVTPCNAHGDCDHKLTGSGICTCNEGFTGRDCDSCQHGYSGPNCVLDMCTLCHANAQCVKHGKHVSCICAPGYKGNGSYCQPACLVDNGGCDKKANCSASFQTGEITCKCREGFHGTGRNCSEIVDLCIDDNGDCSEHALCTFFPPDTESISNGQVQCTCKANYTGNGTFCNGDLISTLSLMNETRDFYQAIFDVMAKETKYGDLIRDLFSDTGEQTTIFAPINWIPENTTEINIDIERHVVKEFILLNATVIPSNHSTFLTVSGENITVENPRGMGYFTVNDSRVVKPNIPSINGMIHLIDKPFEAEVMAETLPVRSSPSMIWTPYIIGGIILIIVIVIVVALVITKRRSKLPCFKKQDEVSDDFTFKILTSFDPSEPSGEEMFDASGVFKNPLYDRLVDS